MILKENGTTPAIGRMRGLIFTGKRVGVIGTGSTGMQAIPEIAKQANHLSVFQRAAQYSVPARNAPMDPEEEARVKADYKGFPARNNALPFGQDINQDRAPGKTLEASDAERKRE